MSLIKKLSHVGIIVPKLDIARSFYEQIYGVNTTKPFEKRKGILSSFVELENTKLELMEPIDPNSHYKEWLRFHPKGGIHHISFTTNDPDLAILQFDEIGLNTLTKKSEIDNIGKKSFFIDPEYSHNVLTELKEN